MTEYPVAFAQAVGELRAAGVEGPYSAVLSAEAYTAVSRSPRGPGVASRSQRGPRGQLTVYRSGQERRLP